MSVPSVGKVDVGAWDQVSSLAVLRGALEFGALTSSRPWQASTLVYIVTTLLRWLGSHARPSLWFSVSPWVNQSAQSSRNGPRALRTVLTDWLGFAWHVGRRRRALAKSVNQWYKPAPTYWLKGPVEGIGIAEREVKFYDLRKTSWSESVCQGCFH